MTEGEALSARRSIKESKEEESPEPSSSEGGEVEEGRRRDVVATGAVCVCVLRFIGYARFGRKKLDWQ